ncbi:tripartite tricarboxylate transporter TctB family protein [Radiobacillus sp. PE A8.2]|uniref:tripartite tricarboxylate transporter TctB family protein n=1 Tax=Radiobacillus sp. PE A8.2 TaxID=3380349 RepID=UPI003890DD0A
MMNKFIVYVESLVIFMFGLAILYIINFQTNIAEDLKTGLDSPILFPKLVAGLLMFLAIFQAVAHTIKKRSMENTEEVQKQQQPQVAEQQPNNKALWQGIFILIAFVLIIPVLGFLIASCISMFALVYVFQKVKWYKAAIYSVVSGVIIWSSFEFLLQISLPTGFFGI